VEYPLPVSPAQGAQRHVLRVTERFYRALLTFDAGAAATPAPPARLVRVSAARLALMAARRAPAEALSAAWWRVTGKKVRARNRFHRLLAPLPCFDFRGWQKKQATAGAAGTVIDLTHSPGARPSFRVCVNAGADGAIVAETETSVRAQSDADWTLIAVAGAADLDAAMAGAPGGWLIHLVNGERLEPGALLRIAEAIAGTPGAALVYWDDTEVRGGGLVRAPRLKPDWNADLHWAQDYIGSAAISCAHALAAGGADADAGPAAWFDLVTRVGGAAGADNVRHVAGVLSHRPAKPDDGNAAAARAACVARLTGAAATPDAHGHMRVTWPLPDPPPLVSVIVPTRDRLDLIEPCIDGLLHRTDYPALEVLIADNDSRDRQTLAYLEAIGRDGRVRVVPCPGPFNFAAINNRVARLARGAVLGFLNNDIEVMAPDWLTEMAAHALRPDVGAVGAKLLYPSGLVQHAGVIVGLDGLAGHAHRFYPAAHPGYMGRLQCTQTFSAVTAACLMTRKAAFAEVGGFDETAFPVAYNDVDLCLRLGASGLKTVWTPYAVLRHKETATRERDYSPARLAQYQRESAAFRARWGHIIAHDPHYHPALTRTDESFLR
jgi:GT2 family glycosyltransferase